MSDPVTPMNGAEFSGAATIAEMPLTAMISLRGDLSSAAFGRAVKAVTGTGVPQTRRVLTGKTGTALWMSPDELLLLTSYTQADFCLATIATKMKSEHHMATNLSDARAMFSLAGEAAREVLAKGAPIDLSTRAFGPGDIRRTRMGQLAAAIWMEEDASFRLICFRSVAGFMFDWLKVAAAKDSMPEYLS